MGRKDPARGLDGFFQEPKGIGKIMAELVRKYSTADGGGNRDTVNDRLAMLVSKGILDRRQEAKQWMYFATPEFQERVRKIRRMGLGFRWKMGTPTPTPSQKVSVRSQSDSQKREYEYEQDRGEILQDPPYPKAAV